MPRLPPQFRPWRRGPYVALVLVFLLSLIGWLMATVAVLTAADRAPFGVLCSLVTGGLLLILLSLPLVVARRRARRTTAAGLVANEDASTLLRRGRPDEAARIYEDLCMEARWSPALHALYVHNYGVARLHTGDAEQAIRCMEQALSSGWFEGPLAAHRTHAQLALALAHAVLGQRERATALRDVAVRALSPARRSASWLVDAALAARGGKALELEDDWAREAESTLMPPHVRALAALQRFAITRAGGAYRGDVSALDAKEHAWLAQKWPELRAFLDTVEKAS